MQGTRNVTIHSLLALKTQITAEQIMFRLKNYCSFRYHTFVRKSSKLRQLEVYERKSPIEHVLLRPGMYIGEVEFKTSETWVFNDLLNTMEKQTVTYSPALIKVNTLLQHFNSKNIKCN